MPKIEPDAAPVVYDPPMYSQAVKMTDTETIPFRPALRKPTS